VLLLPVVWVPADGWVQMLLGGSGLEPLHGRGVGCMVLRCEDVQMHISRQKTSGRQSQQMSALLCTKSRHYIMLLSRHTIVPSPTMSSAGSHPPGFLSIGNQAN
jgi:hypothetical protein